MQFFKNVLATVVGLFLFIFLFFFGLIFLGALSGVEDEKITAQDSGVLELNLQNITMDYSGNFGNPLLGLLSEESEVGFIDVLHAIEAAKTDDDIKGISILNNQMQLGMAQCKELRNQLIDFKKSGKFIVSYADVYSQKDYYLNSVSDTMFLNPIGELEFKGLSSETQFFKDFEVKYGVKAEVIRHGKYKSAVEPFLENKMSEDNKNQITSLLNSVWEEIVNDISKSRKIPVNQLNTIAHDLLARTPQRAVSQKLIDKIAYEDEYHDAIKKILKIEADEDYKAVPIYDYAKENMLNMEGNLETDKIAVIYAQGEIRGGEGSVEYIGEQSMRRSLQDAKKDENIKAIVLRINSPGGSSLTSDLIWREIEITKKVKPVVVSMGNYAASGGYYIACNAHHIFAEPSTITGSIGVFGVLPNVSELSKKLGINSEVVSTHKNAADYSGLMPLSESQKFFLQESVEQVYTTFISRVAAGRKMTTEQVDAIAQGRVWSGMEASKNGLVDAIGGLNDAISKAAALAKVSSYSTQNFPEFEEDFRDALTNKLPFGFSKSSIIKKEIGEKNYEILQKVKAYTSQKGIQTRMPFEINIK